MTPSEARELVERFIDEVFNKQNLVFLERYFAQDLVNHSLPPSLPPGIEGTRVLVSIFLHAFPDLKLTLEDLVVEGDRIVSRWCARGTHRGYLLGIPPTGKQVEINSIGIDRFENGRSVEHWEVMDQLSLMVQLGFMPTTMAA